MDHVHFLRGQNSPTCGKEPFDPSDDCSVSSVQEELHELWERPVLERTRSFLKNSHMHTSPSVPAATFAVLSHFLIVLRFSQIPREDGSMRIAHLQFLEKSHTRGSHRSLTSEDFATDIRSVEHSVTLRTPVTRLWLNWRSHLQHNIGTKDMRCVFLRQRKPLVCLNIG